MKQIMMILFCVFISFFSVAAFSKEDLKIGYLFDLTGPFAPAGSLGGYRGSIVASDMINDQGGILGKYKIVPIVSDSQSSPDVALREAERLISVEKVPVILLQDGCFFPLVAHIRPHGIKLNTSQMVIGKQ